MAVELVAGVILSVGLEVVFDRLLSPEVVDYLKGKRLGDELIDKLKAVVSAVNAVLDDAEEKQITNPSVKQWLSDLEDASCDADDLLDKIASRALKSKLEGAGSMKTKTSKLLNSALSCRAGRSKNTRYMKNKLKEILKRLESLEKGIHALVPTISTVGKKPRPRSQTTSLVEKSDIFGREEVKNNIIKLLLADDEGGKKVSVIPIVGMGGIGKTTLAKLAYNDDKVEKHFTLKAWVYVSEEFDICKVTKSILTAIASSSNSYDHCANNLDLLQKRLKEELVGKKFLIVLDDVWTENYNEWRAMSLPFHHAAQGSKIIITTRSEDLVNMTVNIPTHFQLDYLNEEDCWQLFAKHAFDNIRDPSVRQVLETTGKQIARKCQGLPLAAKTLGGLLRSKEDVGEWEKILESEIWELPQGKSPILPVLMSSYSYLPLYLKRCFAICSIFPKGHQFKKHNLVLLWMAENLLRQPETNKRSMEEVGDEYFNQLVSMSFFQRSSKKDQDCFVMHDLLHDLAKCVSREYCFTLEDGKSRGVMTMKVRHLAVHKVNNNTLEGLNSISKPATLRTIIVRDRIPDEVVNGVIERFKCLRVLILCSCNQLHESVGDLEHLRYLDLSCSAIKRLPESVSRLCNLQILKLSKCKYLIQLPNHMHHLINLRHLDIRGCSELKEMPRHISKLKSLQRLTTFIVGKYDGAKTGELRELSDLRGSLSLENLQNVANAKEASEAKLMEKEYLEELKLSWNGDSDESKRDRDVLEELLPHTNLQRLYISGYGDTTFPKWLGDGALCSILFLKLSDCKFCISLPPIGQLPLLKNLEIEGLEGIVKVGAQFYGNRGGSSCMGKAFASLEFLSFNKMSNWQEWCIIDVEDGGAFPKLQELIIRDCDSLSSLDLSHNLPCLRKLIIVGDTVVVSSLPRTPALHELNLSERNLSGSHEKRVLVLDSCSRRCKKPVLKEASQPIRAATTVAALVDHSVLHPYIFAFGSSITIRNWEKVEFPLMFHSLRRSSIQRVELRNSCGPFEFFILDFFPNLTHLNIEGCKNLESPTLTMQDEIPLSELIIKECPNFICFPNNGRLHAPSLRCLAVEGCKKLKKLPEQMCNLLPSLEDLRIVDCPEVESFPEGGLPSNLTDLCIGNCSKLFGQRKKWNLQTLQALTHFTIEDGYGVVVESFPEEGLLPSNLTCLKIIGMASLKNLDINGLQQLSSLKELLICKEACPQLQKLQPHQALPPQIKINYYSKYFYHPSSYGDDFYPINSSEGVPNVCCVM